MSKISAGAVAIGLSLCMVVGAAAAPPNRGGGGGHPVGGGGGRPMGAVGGGGVHIGGGAPHIGGAGAIRMGGAAPHFNGGSGVPHFTTRAVPRISAATPHVSSHIGGNGVRFSHAPSFRSAGRGPSFRSAARGPSFRSVGHGPTAHANARAMPSFNRANSSVNRATAGTGARTFAGARSLGPNHFSRAAFTANRNFAANGAFHPFWHQGWHPGWHPFHHVGWLGPLFWPYAYGDFFYYSLWPYDYGYDDPLWVYGYGDIYEGIFAPDVGVYDQYVQGPGAPQRMATLTQTMAQSCDNEASEVTGWPIDQIQSAVQPTPDQSALLDDLGNAVVKASDVIRSHCPTTVSFTPTGRIDDMQQRLQGMVQAVDIVSPPLGKFYDSLSDEQKARFNAIGANTQNGKPEAANGQPQNSAGNAPDPRAECEASVMAWPSDQINRVVRPNDAQRAKLDALQSAAMSAQDTIKAACPAQLPATPPERLAAAGNHLKAMLQGIDQIRPALHDFYDSLNNDQKARFNTLGKQLFAQSGQTQEQ